MNYLKIILFLFILHFLSPLKAENGYELWLRYKPIEDSVLRSEYQNLFNKIVVAGESPTIAALKSELTKGLKGMLSIEPATSNKWNRESVIIGNINHSEEIAKLINQKELGLVGDEGYLIKSITKKNSRIIVVAANSDIGALYGTFHLLKLMQTHQHLNELSIIEAPKTKIRILNHWDNLDRTVERGYAGFSIWDWHRLPDYISSQYIDYARANTSIGINGTVVSNVNANALMLTPTYIRKLTSLADIFRPYGIKVYLTARFSAPIEIGGLETADPLNKEVIEWWNSKVKEIYSFIPDFGGFLVKANSEGQPGPQDYNRTHADGANMLGKALSPYNGVVMWRAFVYSNEAPDDRAKQAYNEFKPLDGEFADNVLIQVKNGPIDFQPREPFHPLFGAMEKTPLMMEFQITQEYLGCATHLVYLASLFKETLESDTYAKGENSTIARAVDGTLHNQTLTGMAGVSNIGTDFNWTGHPFGQANWYAFGKLAWNHNLSAEEIADEWLRRTFTNNESFINVVKPIMMNSRETAVKYMTPLGLHHVMARSHHWGPGPWVDEGRADWTSVYYHQADQYGLGFDRTSKGSNAVSQYFPEVNEKYNNIQSCPEELLLWFHHVPWDYKMKSGLSLWNELCEKYYSGAEEVKKMQKSWNNIEGIIDNERFFQVQQLLNIQAKEAIWWRNAILLYFQQFSKQPIPEKFQQPEKSLEYYQNLKFYFVPGI